MAFLKLFFKSGSYNSPSLWFKGCSPLSAEAAVTYRRYAVQGRQTELYCITRLLLRLCASYQAPLGCQVQPLPLPLPFLLIFSPLLLAEYVLSEDISLYYHKAETAP